MSYCKLGIVNLGGRLSAQLSRRLKQQKYAAHTWMVRGESATIGVQRWSICRSIKTKSTSLNPASTFALGTKTQIL
jgi:hypothetical protein